MPAGTGTVTLTITIPAGQNEFNIPLADIGYNAYTVTWGDTKSSDNLLTHGYPITVSDTSYAVSYTHLTLPTIYSV